MTALSALLSAARALRQSKVLCWVLRHNFVTSALLAETRAFLFGALFWHCRDHGSCSAHWSPRAAAHWHCALRNGQRKVSDVMLRCGSVCCVFCERVVFYLHCGTPCNTFSSARKDECPMGLPDLSPDNWCLVQLGNLFLGHTCEACVIVFGHGGIFLRKSSFEPDVISWPTACASDLAHNGKTFQEQLRQSTVNWLARIEHGCVQGDMANLTKNWWFVIRH